MRNDKDECCFEYYNKLTGKIELQPVSEFVKENNYRMEDSCINYFNKQPKEIELKTKTIKATNEMSKDFIKELWNVNNKNND